MFVVLQPGGDLQEAVAQIIDENICRSYSPQYLTNRMICTGYPCASNGLCNVRGYITNKFVCEIFLFHSNTTIILIIPV